MQTSKPANQVEATNPQPRDVAAAATTRPFIRWAGGKSRLLPALMPHVPAGFSNYHEPFLGGGAMFFAVAHRARNQRYLSDLNPDLINAWQSIQDPSPEFIERLSAYLERDSEEFYYSQRRLAPDSPDAAAARFLYLNQTSWNGLWRVNRKGEFNVPWGRRSFKGFDEEVLQSIKRALTGVVIEFTDFRSSLRRAASGDFVYLDPPYLPLSATSKFRFYTEQRFTLSDLEELADICRDLTKRKIRWMMSNRDTPTVRELFSDARIFSLTAKRSVAAQNRRDVETRNSPEAIVVGTFEE